MENRVPALDGERVFRAGKRPKTIYGTVKKSAQLLDSGYA